MKAIRVHTLGGPEVLTHEDTPDPRPGPGEALVRIAAAGVNFLDIYYRSGFHWGGWLPATFIVLFVLTILSGLYPATHGALYAVVDLRSDRLQMR